MRGHLLTQWRRITRHLLAVLAVLAAFAPAYVLGAAANSGDRTLHFHYTHTSENISITFRRAGRFDQAALGQLNNFLRDWRNGQPADMDPALFDILWEIYQAVGATQPIHIVSAYRSPASNAMLRANSSGVAENSLHMRGQAMDFFIPGVPVSTLRETAMRLQGGGVGYYPSSGSAFVHVDTGQVRAWPRLTRTQLANLFPDGRTLHLPTDGTPLSREGTQYAQAQYAECRRVPCPSAAPPGGGGPRTLMDMLFGGGDDTVQVASAPRTTAVPQTTVPQATAPQQAATAPQTAAIVPVPSERPAFLGAGEPTMVASIDDPGAAAAIVPIPATLSQPLLIALRDRTDEPPLTAQEAIAVAALDEAPVPRPRLLMSPPRTDDLVTAYLPRSDEFEVEPDAQRALQLLIERRNAEVADAAPPAAPEPTVTVAAIPDLGHALAAPGSDGLRTASVGGGLGLDTLGALLENTWTALTGGGAPPAPPPAVTAEPAAIGLRPSSLHAPDLEHVVETFVTPLALTDARFAVMAPAEGDLDPATELGAYTGAVGFAPPGTAVAVHDRFTRDTVLLFALR